MNNIFKAMKEEVTVMLSGTFMPYHKVAWMIGCITAIVFSVVLSHVIVFEAKIAVIDLDHSSYSVKLIENVRSSAFIEVTSVVHSPTDPVSLLNHDANVGVLYLPKNLEENLKSGKKGVTLGYFADYANSSQNAEVVESLNGIAGAMGAELSLPKVAALSYANDASAEMSPLSVSIRRLFNPVFSAANSSVISFLYFFSSIYFSLTMLMLMGRFKVSGQFERIMGEGPVALICRVLPYVLIYVTVLSFLTCIMVNFGQLRFHGNYFAYLPSLFLTGMNFGMLALLLSWKTSDPCKGSSLMILLVPPGYITCGATLAVGILPHWAYLLSHCFPLVWQFKFFRDFALRGSSLQQMTELYGLYLGYAAIIGLLLTLRWYLTAKKMNLIG